MNCFAGFTRPVMGGHHAMLRFAEDGQPEPVKCEGGKPKVFPTELEAWKAVAHHLVAYFNGKLRRDGEKANAVRAIAESHFVKQKGKTRRIEVATKSTFKSPRKPQDERDGVLMREGEAKA